MLPSTHLCALLTVSPKKVGWPFVFFYWDVPKRTLGDSLGTDVGQNEREPTPVAFAPYI